MRTCKECGADISHKRADAVSCSIRCGNRVAQKKLYWKNPEIQRLRVNAYNHANKQFIAKKYADNREAIQARKRAEYAANPKKKSDYYTANHARIAEVKAKHYANNREKFLQKNLKQNDLVMIFL